MYEQLSKAVDEIPYFKRISRKYRYKTKQKNKLSILETVVKDKAWTLLSDYTRLRDFITYGKCASCPKRFTDWRESQGGHFISMASHGALIGFSELNVHAQCHKCNYESGMDKGKAYGDELEKRYGPEFIPELHIMKSKTIDADSWYFLERIKALHKLLTELKNKYPDYEYPEYV